MKNQNANYLDAVETVITPEMSIKIESNESWWGIATTSGSEAPITEHSEGFSRDLRIENYSNQAVPLLVSNQGRYIWSDKAFMCSVKNGEFVFEADSTVYIASAGTTLRDAFLAASKKHFPPSGKLPDLALIANPQWNTWIELTYNQNQKDILAYAKAIGENGFPEGGVMMIDDTWQYGYGIWEFDPRKFSDPKLLCDELHNLGFKIMLWVCPFVSMDSPGYREMAFGMKDAGVACEKGGLICDAEGEPVAAKWWNGKSASIDFSHPLGAAWFARQLATLQEKFGVDGWKFDAGDTESYKAHWVTKGECTPSEMSEAYAKIGLEFPLNEYRACFKMGGQPIVQRLCDKGHSWYDLSRLIPDMVNCGLLGHPFVCPDMIGGGNWVVFTEAAQIPFDPELFVRSAQVHALSPMMQFSAAPWRVLDTKHLDAVRSAAWIRMKYAQRFVELAKECACTGEPMLRNMEYNCPGKGWETIKDQFMMGDFLVVAPQIEKGATERKVVLPEGMWRADDSSIYEGPCEIIVSTPLERIPHFERINS